MKPAPFAYHRPASLDEALEALARLGPDARILAGGQSLVHALNMRLAQPSALVDINRVPGLDAIRLAAQRGVAALATRGAARAADRPGHAARGPPGPAHARHLRRQPGAR